MQDRYFDNTRIKDFRTCPRKFYFRHSRNWAGTGFMPALVFGSAWHEAMDIVWEIMSKNDPQKLRTQEVAECGYEAFLTCWVENGGPDPKESDPFELDRLQPRVPMNALEMLYAYVDERRALFSRPGFELLAVEQPFAVPLDPEDATLFYVGRMDKIFAIKDEIYVGEHKTSSLYSKASTFRSTYIDSFSPDSQIDGYLHAAHMLYGDKAKAVWVDAALVHKTVHDGFVLIPVERQHAQLDAWLWEARYWIHQIEVNCSLTIDDENSYMSAFPKNTNSCQDFARNCPYIDLCKMWSNPTVKEQPAGFENEPWSPFDRLELNKIGLEK